MKRELQSSGIEELERRRLLSLTPVGTPTSLEAGAIAIAGNGDYIALHVSSKDHVLKAERYGSDGVGKELMTVATFGDSIEGFNISMDDAGDAAVVCESGDSVYVVRISKDDVVSKLDLVAKTPDDPEAYDIEDTAISMDPAGGYFVGWTTGYTETGPLQETVQLEAFDSSGKSLAPQFAAVSQNGGYDSFYDLSLAENPDGSGAVYAFTQSIDGPEVYVNVGQASTSKAIGTTQPFEQAHAPSVAVYPDNSFVIAYVIQQVNYSDDNPSQLGDGFVQRFDAQANPIGDPIDVRTDSKQFVVSVGVATLPDGGFVVGSLQTTNLTDLSDVPMDVRTYDADGAAEGSAATEVTKVDVETFNDHPVVGEFVTANDRGNVLIGDVKTDDDVFEPSVPISMTIQQYENQDISLDGSVLNVVGTTANDRIDIRENDGTITVQVGAAVQTFKASEVSAISVAGLDGNDVIRNDTSIPSTLAGGGGADTIYGGDGKDLLSGGGGNDRLYGGLGADHLYGAAGRDRLYGGGGNDYLEGGASGDWLYSQGGNDEMLGDGGDDRLYADYGSGDATLYGGPGDDSFVTADNTLEHVVGGSGSDSAEADGQDILSSIESTQ